MRLAYRTIAFLIAAEVVVQSAAVALGMFGLLKSIDDGAVVTAATVENDETLDGGIGFLVHGINGMFVVPSLALLLLVVAFFAAVPGGVRWAVILFVLVVLQVMLGGFAHDYPMVGALHGLNALAVFVVAMLAAHRARPDAKIEPAPISADSTPPGAFRS